LSRTRRPFSIFTVPRYWKWHAAGVAGRREFPFTVATIGYADLLSEVKSSDILRRHGSRITYRYDAGLP
jgi:hypothetical protein